MEKELILLYQEKKKDIQKRLSDFSKLNAEQEFSEMLFCLLTPQSNAKKCWQAVKEVQQLAIWKEKEIAKILRKHTRFHNNKARYVMNSKETWKRIKDRLNEQDRIVLRNFIAEKVKGYGLKEAGHFLRNIGKSDNQIAILDRHILRNLKEINVIEDEKIKNNKHYLEIEQKFLKYADKIKIPIDELDLLFWSKENGEIFK